jgi:hypothetical protein
LTPNTWRGVGKGSSADITEMERIAMREARSSRWWRASEGNWRGMREGRGWCVGALGLEVVRDMADVQLKRTR